MWPGVHGLNGGTFTADTHTAGAVTLLLQAALPVALLGARDSAVAMRLRGGTNVPGSPAVDYVQMALMPLLARFGVPPGSLRLTVARRGYYPHGGGAATVDVVPVHRLSPIELTERGSPLRVRAVVHGTGRGKRAIRAVVALVRQRLRAAFPDVAAVEVSADAQESQTVDAGTPPPRRDAKGQRPRPTRSGEAASHASSEGSRAGAAAEGLTFRERRALSEEAYVALSPPRHKPRCWANGRKTSSCCAPWCSASRFVTAIGRNYLQVKARLWRLWVPACPRNRHRGHFRGR